MAVAGGISKDGRCHLLVGMSIALLCERLQISIVRFSHQMHENPTCNVMNISGQRGRRGHIKKTLFLSFLINRIRCNHIRGIVPSSRELVKKTLVGFLFHRKVMVCMLH